MRNAAALNAIVSLDEILARPDVWCADHLATATIPTIASGFAELDAELPGGGWPRGSLTEILTDRVGFGECSLLMPAFARMRADDRWSLLVAPPHQINAPAWAACGIDLSRLVIVSPTRPHDALWATEHALSSGAFGMVLCWKAGIDARQVRRLQVAVAGCDTLAFLFRPGREKPESSAATLRLLLSAGASGALNVELLKRRGPPCGRTLRLAVPRPMKWREDHEFQGSKGSSPTLARTSPAAPFARSQRPVAVA